MKAGRTPWTVNMNEWKIIDADGNDVCQIRGKGEQYRKGNANTLAAMGKALELVEKMASIIGQDEADTELNVIIRDIIKTKNGEA